MSIQFKAVQQALKFLGATGAEYAIRFEGREYGNARLEEPKKKTTRTVKFRWNDLYMDWVKNVQPGDAFKHEVDTLDEAKSLRSSLSGQLGHYYGPQTYMTSATLKEDGKYTVEALYIGKTTEEAQA